MVSTDILFSDEELLILLCWASKSKKFNIWSRDK